MARYCETYEAKCKFPSFQGDGKLFLGLNVENGRIKGEMKKAIRAVLDTYDLPVRITANQNLVLCDIKKAWRSPITRMLQAAGAVVRSPVAPYLVNLGRLIPFGAAGPVLNGGDHDWSTCLLKARMGFYASQPGPAPHVGASVCGLAFVELA